VAEARTEVTILVSIYSDVIEAPDGVAYQGHFAADDQFVDSSQVAGLQAALGDRGEAHIYPGTKHWFGVALSPIIEKPPAGSAR
jgi:hypothetical protein